MKMRFWLLIITIVFHSCNNDLYKQDFRGKRFVNKSELSSYRIQFEGNNKLVVIRNIPNRIDTCVGSWKFIADNKILINCQSVNGSDDKLINALQPNYIICNDTIKLISKSKIKFRNGILQEQESNHLVRTAKFY